MYNRLVFTTSRRLATYEASNSERIWWRVTSFLFSCLIKVVELDHAVSGVF